MTHKIGSGLFGDVYAAKSLQQGQVPQKAENLRKLTTYRGGSDRAPFKIIIKVAYNSESHLQEANVAYDVSRLVEKRICPHFPLSYGYYLCKNARFYGSRGLGVYKEAGWWDRVKGGTGIIQLAEYAGMSFWKWLDTKPSSQEIDAVIAQVMIGIYALQKHAKLVHNDLYFSNITMMKVNEPQCFRYIVNKVEYNIEVKKYYPVIIDYGQSEKTKRAEGSGDIFYFLSDFSVGYSGERPMVDRYGRITTSVSIPRIIRRRVITMLYDILKYHENINTHAEHKEWLKKRYMNTDELLKKHYEKLFKKRLQYQHTTFRI